MKKLLPKINQEVLVQLESGSFAVAAFDGADWYTGTGVYSSYENGNYTLSSDVVSWSELPNALDNNVILTQAEKDSLRIEKENKETEMIKPAIKNKR